MIQRVLLIEDDKIYSTLLTQKIESKTKILVDTVTSFEAAQDALSKKHYDYLISDIYLPDSNGEHIKQLAKNEHKVIVITASDKELENSPVLNTMIVDYFIKGDKNSIEQLINLLQEINQNKSITIAVIDDSKLFRGYIKNLLEYLNLSIKTYVSAEEFLELMHPNAIDLILVDYYLPGISGLELIKKVRMYKSPDELPILVYSSSNIELILPRLLKQGANDYLKKPFSKEEIYCRVNINLANAKLLQQTKYSASLDPLTALHNRSHIYNEWETIVQQANYFVNIDIDYFKQINDTYGHDVGDEVLKLFAKALRNYFSEDTLVRYGGEEFLVISKIESLDELTQRLLALKTYIKENPLRLGSQAVHMTFSAGLKKYEQEPLKEIFKATDKLLYEAKESGRDKILH